MNRKQLIGLISGCVGIFFTILAFHLMHKVDEAKGFAENVTNFFTRNPTTWNPIIKFFGGEAQEEISKYDASILTLLILGIVLAIAGAATLFVSRKKTKN